VLTIVQILKASRALQKHIKTSEQGDSTSKQNLLADADEEEDDTATPIWLILTTKKHIIAAKRLKPTSISVPHPLNASSTTTICLITADPQRAYKDIIASPAFPPALSARITRVIALSKIKAKYSQYEAQRKLYAEHDIFLADDRVITSLPKVLGSTFYKKTIKRPIPVSLQPAPPRTDGKRIARAKGEPSKAGEPKTIAAEIEKALKGALVNLSPSTTTSVKVGYASWDAEKVAENVGAVADALIERFVPKKWRGVRAIHIKGPTTAALPIWLADEMWADEEEVVEKAPEMVANVGKKRKAIESVAAVEEMGEKAEKAKKLPESNDDKLDKEIALRKEKLQKQKAEAAKDVAADDVPKPAKKSKQSKTAVAANDVKVSKPAKKSKKSKA
jgi:ribosome biogenesis protein UTP30